MTAMRKGPESGAAALEMALVAPLFMTIVLGTLNVGWGLYCGAEVRHAVERTSRMLIVDPETDITVIEAAVKERLLSAEADDVDVTMATETVGTTGEIARLTWTYAYTIDVPFTDPVVLNFDSSMIVPLRPT